MYVHGHIDSQSPLGLLSQWQYEYHPSSASSPPLSHSQSLSGELGGLCISSRTGSGSFRASGQIGSPGSPPSCGTSSHPKTPTCTLQGNLSTHPLQNHLHFPTCPHNLKGNRFSGGDFDQGDNSRHHCPQQGHTGRSPLETDSVSAILQGMTKAYRYNPQEKRERIERYRTKRNQRNFHRKIQYACRKTLADSRKRIRGRFVRNDESDSINNSPELHWTQMTVEADDEDYQHWIYLLHSMSSHVAP